ncbi:hypothetical protein PCNPT3_10610 [Psychromonas sp. CNPT3]|uniref:hypothetical protein n=1 Tax=Psychromonas sp. CNPT3 TaxID=314282 RepID=UPI00006E78F4|nr:hypothetical protein [Psychromonas sp. CNPT3]AGH82060.1 hypothetical protein PCNPT3_10610 [Psychromonas sp. CNPT3]
MLLKYKLIGLSTLFLLSACASDPAQETSVGDIPSWILNPQVEEGIAVAECVLFSGNMSIDKQQVLAIARTSLAQRIETRVSAMDKIYREKIEVKTGVQSGSTFSSVSKLITEQVLVGTTPLKMDITKIAGKDNLCVLMAMGQESTKALFESLVTKADRPMSADQEDVLYQEFKAQRANDELNLELEKLHK